MKQEIYCGGKFISTNNYFSVNNPYNGEVIAECGKADKDNVNNAIEAALKVKDEMKSLPSYEKYSILMQISAEIKKNKKELAQTLSSESGKPLKYALVEIDRAAETFLVAAEESKRVQKEYISLDWNAAGKNKEGLVKYFAAGVVAGITPFNFPINLVAHKVAPAIAAGCPVIIKPASATPLTALALAKIVDGTTLPKGAFSVLPCDRETGNMLATDVRINVLSFTGSPEVGWKLKSIAGKKKVVLELGGNAGVLIHEDADIDHAVKRCLVGGFAYSGQVCIHAQRMYIHEKVFDTFSEKFISGVKALKEGNPNDVSTDVSGLIDAPNAERIEKWIGEALQNGAQVLCGGKRKGSYYEPTVLTNTTTSMKVNCEEVFGPVVVIEKCKDFAHGISLLNDTRFGLQTGIFTYDQRNIELAFNHLDVGGVILNDVPTFRADHMPYGGIKDSGFGREGVKYAMMDYMEAKILVK